MTKIKKISINEFENALNENFDNLVQVEWNGLEIIVKKTLDIAEMLAFVNNVSEACFNKEDYSYSPAVEDFAIRSAFVELYTNIRMPVNIQRRYDLIYQSGIVEHIVPYINASQYNAIIEAVRKSIDHMANANIITTNKQIDTLLTEFENLQNQMEGVFSGVGSEDVKALIGALGNSGVDEEKIVQAYLNNK